MLTAMGLRCLIVDDSAPFLRAAQGLLEREGITVAVASTSAEALQRTEEVNPDVVLVDIDLGAENGFDLARQLDQEDRSGSIILISSHSREDFEELIEDSPAGGFLGKSSLSAAAIKSLISGDDGAGSAPRDT